MRFRAIDTFRGIAAILIILFHMKGYIQLLMGNKIVEHSDIAVDFFFVLSGFVITYSSINKITNWDNFKKFITKRAYRIYPLHLFTLLLAVLLETFRFVIDHYIVHLTQPVFAKNNIFSLFAHLTLTHSLGLFNNLTWNIPSWSISSEFYVYVIWGLSLILFRKRIALLFLAYFLIISYFIYSHDGKIQYTYDYGLLRCLYGFMCGMMLYYVSKRIRTFGTYSGTILEIASIIFTLSFIQAYQDKSSWLMPLWFSVVILIFTQESGIVSKLLALPRLEFLGKLSYSYYLNHSFILAVYDIFFFKVIKLPHNSICEFLYISICLLSVHIASVYTYKYIELRFQRKQTSPSGGTLVLVRG